MVPKGKPMTVPRSQAGQDGGEMIGRAVATFRRMRADLKREGL